MRMWLLAIAATVGFSAQLAVAGTCEVHYVRTACPGQEKISYKKCGGKQECTKKKRADDVAECQDKAAKSCSNSRLNITKSKVITASFDGSPITTKDGKDNFCEEDRADFNKCDS